MLTEKLYTKTEENTNDWNCGSVVDDSEQPVNEQTAKMVEDATNKAMLHFPQDMVPNHVGAKQWLVESVR